jgi:hypothetical protein
MRTRASRTVQTGAISGVALVVSLLLTGCDSNPGGPSAPRRPPSAGEVVAPTPPEPAAGAKKIATRRGKKVSDQSERALSIE